MVIDKDDRSHDGEDERSGFEEQIPATDDSEEEDKGEYPDVGVPVEKVDYDDPGVIVVKSIDDERHEVNLRRPDASMRLVGFWKPEVTITDNDLSDIWRYFCDPEKNRHGFLTRDDFSEIRGGFEDPGIKSK